MWTEEVKISLCHVIVSYKALVQQKSMDIFLISPRKHTFWVLIRSAFSLEKHYGYLLEPAGSATFFRRDFDHELFSTVILSLLLIQEGQLSVSGERMCTILVNCLED